LHPNNAMYKSSCLSRFCAVLMQCESQTVHACHMQTRAAYASVQQKAN